MAAPDGWLGPAPPSSVTAGVTAAHPADSETSFTKGDGVMSVAASTLVAHAAAAAAAPLQELAAPPGFDRGFILRVEHELMLLPLSSIPSAAGAACAAVPAAAAMIGPELLAVGLCDMVLAAVGDGDSI